MISRPLAGAPLLLVAAICLAQETEPTKPDTLPYPTRSCGRAVLLSLLIPGGGQVYTRNYWKAALIAPTEVTLGGLAYHYHELCRKALARGDTGSYYHYSNQRTTFLWWTGAAIAFSMADAYVSAQMFGFTQQMRLALAPGRLGIAIGL